MSPLLELCRSCTCGTRGIEMKQLIKSKHFQQHNQQHMDRGLLTSLATALKVRWGKSNAWPESSWACSVRAAWLVRWATQTLIPFWPGIIIGLRKTVVCVCVHSYLHLICEQKAFCSACMQTGGYSWLGYYRTYVVSYVCNCFSCLY